MQGYSTAAGAGPPEAPLDAGEVLQASPSVVLAEAGPRPGGGKVLSVAPLLGAAASVDSGHPRWLHVHVRPPARGLLKTVRVRVLVLVVYLYCRRSLQYMLSYAMPETDPISLTSRSGCTYGLVTFD